MIGGLAMKNKWIYLLLAVLFVFALAGFWLYSRQTPDVVQAKPDLVISADAFTKAFEQDGVSASKRYNGKIIQVSGRVKSVNNAGAVVLGSEANASEVVIGLDQRHKGDVRKLRAGQRAVFQGVYSGYEQDNGGADDLLSGLGATVQLRSAGLKDQE